ncbi:MAG TPA: hypothetical protein VF307_05225 [Candidatus Nanopelagicaceae bacterium]
MKTIEVRDLHKSYGSVRAADSGEVTVLNFDPQVKGVNARESRNFKWDLS